MYKYISCASRVNLQISDKLLAFITECALKNISISSAVTHTQDR